MDAIRHAKRPVLYVGGGCVDSGGWAGQGLGGQGRCSVAVARGWHCALGWQGWQGKRSGSAHGACGFVSCAPACASEEGVCRADGLPCSFCCLSFLLSVPTPFVFVQPPRSRSLWSGRASPWRRRSWPWAPSRSRTPWPCRCGTMVLHVLVGNPVLMFVYGWLLPGAGPHGPAGANFFCCP